MVGCLTYYLFRTLKTRATGLRVKLKIVCVNRVLGTFDEEQYPAASIMPHGLFLAMPTPHIVKDPVLVAILNQTELSDQYSDTCYGVVSIIQDTEVNPPEIALAKRLPHSSPSNESSSSAVAYYKMWLVRDGMVKALPNSVAFTKQSTDSEPSCSHLLSYYQLRLIDYRIPESDGPASQVSWTPNPHPIQLAEWFRSTMRDLLEALRDMPIRAISKIIPESDNGSTSYTQDQERDKLRRNMSQVIEIFGPILKSLHSTAERLNRFFPPHQNADRVAFESLLDTNNKQLQELLACWLHFLIRPLVVAGGRCSAELASQIEDFDHQVKHIRISAELIENFARSSHDRIAELQQANAHQILMNQSVRMMQRSLPIYEILGLLMSSSIRQDYCTQLEALLDMQPKEPKFMSEVSNRITNRPAATAEALPKFKRSLAAHGKFLATQTRHKQWKVLNARSCQPTEFFPAIDAHQVCRLQAVVVHQQTKICVAAEYLPTQEGYMNNDEQQKPYHTFIFVFEGASEIARFKLEPSRTAINRLGARQFCTGRYFLKIFNRFRQPNAKELTILDLKPCLKSIPEPPISMTISFSQILGDAYSNYQIVTCTNEFVSFFSVAFKHSAEQAHLEVDFYNLSILSFATLPQNTIPKRIPLADDLQPILRKIPKSSFLEIYPVFYNKVCWFKDLKTFFYMSHQSYGKSESTPDTLLITCFEVSLSHESANLVTHSCFKVSDLMSNSISDLYEFQFHSLATRTREYLVLEIVYSNSWLMNSHSPTVVGRILFTMHKKKLQVVQVNGQTLYEFPARIGQRLGCAGYESPHLSLFHHRRVFSADKVVSTVSRLHYTPL